MGGQGKVVRLAYDELESALLQEWDQRDQPGGADLFAQPPGSSKRWVGHGLFSIGLHEDAVACA